jgi:NOL1/NOP2/sun family putative RNA methylase
MNKKEFFINRYKQLGWTFKNTRIKQTIRINNCNIDKKKLLVRLKKEKIQLQPVPFLKDAFWVIKSKVSVGATAEYLLGFYSIQEAASQIPVSVFKKLKEKKVLDACAAPGGKTVQLANYMKNTGEIVALDIRKKRLIALTNHLERCHINNTIVFFLDARKIGILNTKFDRILIDAPCSGNFTMDNRWFNRRTPKDIKRNAKLQRELLAKCKQYLDDHGEMVYSTCSLEPEENELNMDWAIRNLNLKIEKINCFGGNGVTNIFGQKLHNSISRCKRIWPGDTQGFFICKLRKRW